MSYFRTNIDASSIRFLAKRYRAAPALVETALIRSLNRGGDGGLTEVRKELPKRTGIRPSDTRRSKGITRVLATKKDATYRVKARSQYTPLSYFRPKQQAAGVRAEPWNRKQLFKGTFMLRMSTGYVGVFRRNTAAPIREIRTRAGRTIRSRPIKELWGPSLAVEMMKNGIPETFARVARDRMAARLPHEIEHAFRTLAPERVVRTA